MRSLRRFKGGWGRRLSVASTVLLGLVLGAAPAEAGPSHPEKADPIEAGFPLEKACGTATDSEGDIYVASAGASKIEVFDPSGTHLASIPDANEPCGLATDSVGHVYATDKATGQVIRYTPNIYPFAGAPVYGPPSTIDPSGDANGISVDPTDDALYVAEGTRVAMFNAGGTPGIDEEQKVSTEGATAGNFKLVFGGQETAPLAWNATNGQIQTALEALSTIGSGNVAVKEGPSGSFDHRVTFRGAFGGTDVELLGANTAELTGSISREEAVKGFDGHIASGDFTDATGVAAYTYAGETEKPGRYLFVADAATDRVLILEGNDVRTLGVGREIAGPAEGESFGFGAAGAYLAVDPGNANAEKKCASIAEQACTAGHLLVYDDAHEVVDEFDASGEFLDAIASQSFSDAQPTAMAVDRSGGPNDGTIYVTAGAGPGSKVLAFEPSVPPSRASLPSLSRVLPNAATVATDSHGDVYVAAGSLIHVYRPDGAELLTFEDPLQAQGLAVDSKGNVYVADVGVNANVEEHVVTYYSPSQYPPTGSTTYARHSPPLAVFESGETPNKVAIAIDPGNDHAFFARGHHLVEFDSAANGSAVLNDHCAAGLEGFTNGKSLAVYGRNHYLYLADNSGRVYVETCSKVLARIDGRGSPQGPFTPAGPAIVVDQDNGHALVFDNKYGSVREYDAAGGFVGEFGKFTTTIGGRPFGLALDNSNGPGHGNLYVAFDDTAPGSTDVTTFGPLSYGGPPAVNTGFATGVGGGNATLNGTVNPDGFTLESCEFQYLSETEYEAQAKTFAGSISVPCEETPAQIGTGSDPISVKAAVTGLDPSKRYRFRLVARNREGEDAGDAGLLGPPSATTKDALPVLYREATLRGEVETSGLPTTYRFEYGPDPGEYDKSTPPAELPPGDTGVPVHANVSGLAEGTTYHFRLLVESEAVPDPVAGEDRAFATLSRNSGGPCPNSEFRTGLSAGLPDCRAYELVTPGETKGAILFTPNPPSSGFGFNNWLTPPRGPGAGEALTYATTSTLPGFDGSGQNDSYRAERASGPHPAAGWGSEVVGPTYVQGAGSGSSPFEGSPDQRYSFWQVGEAYAFEGTLPAGMYLRTPSGTAGPDCNPDPGQANFEVLGCGDLGTDLKAESLYVSSNGEHVLFASKAHLEPLTPLAADHTQAIYDRPAGSAGAEVISVKPDGAAFGAGENAVYVAASEDGSAVVFRAGGALYVHEGGQTIEVAVASSPFAGISDDGRWIFYAASGSGATPASLFACDVEAGPCAGAGSHSPIEVGPTSSEGVFVGVSSDGSGVLFTSTEALTGSEENEVGQMAESGKDNLYSWRGGTTSFVAVLDPADFAEFGGSPVINLGTWVASVTAGTVSGHANAPVRSTPDGDVFLFQSHAKLTAYDNEGHGEIYRYLPAGEPGEQLACVSCNPSGAPPGDDAMLEQIDPPLLKRTIIPNVTDSGDEVFFQSADRLLPEDANDVIDVYEWKAKGSGGCTRDGGCLGVISSGQDENDSVLYSMSASGKDVFFVTLQELVGADVPGSFSIYDARVDGGIPDAVKSPPCEGDSCQSSGGEPPTLPSPATTGEAEPPGTAPRCGKGRRLVRGRCVARHPKHHRHRRHGHGRRGSR